MVSRVFRHLRILFDQADKLSTVAESGSEARDFLLADYKCSQYVSGRLTHRNTYARLGHSFAVPYMPEINIARDLPSAFTRTDYECVFLSARQNLILDAIRNTILTY